MGLWILILASELLALSVLMFGLSHTDRWEWALPAALSSSFLQWAHLSFWCQTFRLILEFLCSVPSSVLSAWWWRAGCRVCSLVSLLQALGVRRQPFCREFQRQKNESERVCLNQKRVCRILLCITFPEIGYWHAKKVLFAALSSFYELSLRIPRKSNISLNF